MKQALNKYTDNPILKDINKFLYTEIKLYSLFPTFITKNTDIYTAVQHMILIKMVILRKILSSHFCFLRSQ